nr:auxin transport protein BIG [Tanacetum cinerariifolium]
LPKGVTCEPSFWDTLYPGGEKAEYLEKGKLDGLHINAFIELMMRKRPRNAQWTLGLSELVVFHIDSLKLMSMVLVVDAFRATIDGTNPRCTFLIRKKSNASGCFLEPTDLDATCPSPEPPLRKGFSTDFVEVILLDPKSLTMDPSMRLIDTLGLEANAHHKPAFQESSTVLPENILMDADGHEMLTEKSFGEAKEHQQWRTCNQVPSGFLLSSIFSIKGIISMLHGLLKVIKAKDITTIQAKVRFEIPESVLSAKTDRVFSSLHGQCDAVYRSLNDSLEGLDYGSFFSLKNMYEFLRDINAQEVVDSSVNECVVSKAVNVIGTIMKDPSRASVLKKFMSDGDVDEQMEDACSSQHGDLLVLINALDNCISESVSGYHLPAE